MKRMHGIGVWTGRRRAAHFGPEPRSTTGDQRWRHLYLIAEEIAALDQHRGGVGAVLPLLDSVLEVFPRTIDPAHEFPDYTVRHFARMLRWALARCADEHAAHEGALGARVRDDVTMDENETTLVYPHEPAHRPEAASRCGRPVPEGTRTETRS